jgi:hypothetical protein
VEMGPVLRGVVDGRPVAPATFKRESARKGGRGIPRSITLQRMSGCVIWGVTLRDAAGVGDYPINKRSLEVGSDANQSSANASSLLL